MKLLGLITFLAWTASAGHWEGVCGGTKVNMHQMSNGEGFCVCAPAHGDCSNCSDYCGSRDCTFPMLYPGAKPHLKCRKCDTPNCVNEFSGRDSYKSQLGCPTGQYGDGSNCQTRDVCDGNATDANTGNDTVNASCSCNNGFYGNGLSCNQRATCDGNATDANNGSTTVNANCSCNEGFYGNGWSCSARQVCDANGIDANAGNNLVNASCSCDGVDFFGTGIECAARDKCDANGSDTNAGTTTANASCVCNEGFFGNGLACAVRAVCHADGIDANAGSTTLDADCSCDGVDFFGDGSECAARDKCDANAADLNLGTTTVNASCVCNDGFYGDGATCQARDVCDANATDANEGSTTLNASCTCNEAEFYFGNGLECDTRYPTASPSISPDYIEEVVSTIHREEFASLRQPTNFVHEVFILSTLYHVTAGDAVEIEISGAGTLDNTEFTKDYVKIQVIGIESEETRDIGTVEGDAFTTLTATFAAEDTIYVKFTVLLTGDDEDYSAVLKFTSGGEVCFDTPRWKTDAGDTCIDFVERNICANGGFTDEFKSHAPFIKTNAALNAPHVNCCACGGGVRSSELCDYDVLNAEAQSLMQRANVDFNAYFACTALFQVSALANASDVCTCLNAFDDAWADNYTDCKIRDSKGDTFDKTLKETHTACQTDGFEETERMDYLGYKIMCEQPLSELNTAEKKASCRNCGGKWSKRGKKGCKVHKQSKVKCKRITDLDLCPKVGQCEVDGDTCSGVAFQ